MMRAAALALATLLTTVAAAAAAPSPSPADYRVLRVQGAGSVTRWRAEHGEDHFLALLKVNRIDAAHALEADTLIVPPVVSPFLDLAPFPSRLEAPDSLPRLLLVSLRVQAFAAYDSGGLVRWGPVNSGGPRSPTPSGAYRVNWTAKEHVSTVDSTWLMRWCMNLDNTAGTALHEYAMPGTPASHGCLRLLADDAAWLFAWVAARPAADSTAVAPGTPVFVFGAYDFDRPHPWRRLPADPGATRVPADEIRAAMSAPLPAPN